MSSFLDHLFDSDHRQREDINALRQQISSQPDPSAALRDAHQRIERLELTLRTLTELMIRRGLASNADIAVLMQQIDLLDGVEDGRISKAVHKAAPTCQSCGRYANPRRRHCVYCRAELQTTAPQRTAPVVRMVHCTQCNASVPERNTFFSSSGLVCDNCFDPDQL